jgi:hypothetical protein
MITGAIVSWRVARAHVDLGQIDEACAVAVNALEDSMKTDHHVVLERLHTFCAKLEPWHAQPNVRPFTEQLLLA